MGNDLERAAWAIARRVAEARIPLVSNWVDQRITEHAERAEAQPGQQAQLVERDGFRQKPWPLTTEEEQAIEVHRAEPADPQLVEPTREQLGLDGKEAWEKHQPDPLQDYSEARADIRGDATLAHGQRSEEELQAWEDLDADLDREERQKDEREDLKFSQYFRSLDGEELRIVSYRTDDGYFFHVDNDSRDQTIASGGPFTTQAAASEAGKEMLFQELNDINKPPDQGSQEYEYRDDLVGGPAPKPGWIVHVERDDDHELGR